MEERSRLKATKFILEIPGVRFRDPLPVLDEHGEGGGHDPDLGDVEGPVPSLTRRDGDRVEERGHLAVERGGGNPIAETAEGILDFLEEKGDPLPRGRHRRDDCREGCVSQILTDFPDPPTALFLPGPQVGLVHGHDDSALLEQDVSQDLLVLVGQPLRTVDHQNREVASLQGIETLEDGELLEYGLGLPFRADPRGVDELVRFPPVGHQDVHRIPCGPRDLRGDYAVIPDESVDEGRLPHVRPAENGDPRHGLLARVVIRNEGGDEPDDRVEEIGYARPVFRRDGVHRSDGQFVKLRGHLLPFPGVHLVCGKEERLLLLAEHRGDFLVEREDAVARVHQENDRVGLVDGPQDLAADLQEDIPSSS
jgi:hypothetical protein